MNQDIQSLHKIEQMIYVIKLNQEGGGLIIYVKNNIYDYITKVDNATAVTSDLEHLWLKINIPYRLKIILGLCYRPPSGNIPIAFSLLTAQLELLETSSDCDLLVLGDFNINYLNQNLSGFKKLKEFERCFLLHQIIDTPTRIHNRCSSLIDLVFTSLDHISHKGTINVYISDHLPTYLVIKKCRKVKSTTIIKGRSFKRYDTKVFQEHVMNDSEWKLFWPQHDVNIKWSIFYDILNHAADRLCPIVPMKCHSTNDGWFTKDVIEAIAEKNRLFKIVKVNNTEENWSLFRIQRKYTRNLMMNTKEEFKKNQIEENRNNPRSFWRKLNGIIGNVKNGKSFMSIFNDDGKKLEKEEAAEFMNNYFITVGKELNETNRTTWKQHSYFQHFTNNNFLLNVMDENTVLKYVRTLDSAKPSGIPNLSNKLMLDAFKVLPG